MEKKKNKKQLFEGKIQGCQQYKCGCSCCDEDQVEEWANEYFLFHEPIKENLIAHGVKMIFNGDRVEFKNCSTGTECKFIKYSLNKDRDARPIDCKIYPYCVDWNKIDFNNKVVNLYYWDNDCPLVKNKKIPEKFKKEVVDIIKRDFAVLFYGAIFDVNFINKVI